MSHSDHAGLPDAGPETVATAKGQQLAASDYPREWLEDGFELLVRRFQRRGWSTEDAHDLANRTMMRELYRKPVARSRKEFLLLLVATSVGIAVNLRKKNRRRNELLPYYLLSRLQVVQDSTNQLAARELLDEISQRVNHHFGKNSIEAKLVTFYRALGYHSPLDIANATGLSNEVAQRAATRLRKYVREHLSLTELSE